jgi:hypothetical protein
MNANVFFQNGFNGFFYYGEPEDTAVCVTIHECPEIRFIQSFHGRLIK